MERVGCEVKCADDQWIREGDDDIMPSIQSLVAYKLRIDEKYLAGFT